MNYWHRRHSPGLRLRCARCQMHTGQSALGTITLKQNQLQCLFSNVFIRALYDTADTFLNRSWRTIWGRICTPCVCVKSYIHIVAVLSILNSLWSFRVDVFYPWRCYSVYLLEKIGSSRVARAEKRLKSVSRRAVLHLCSPKCLARRGFILAVQNLSVAVKCLTTLDILEQ